jgi:hypothetical protein
MVETSFSMVFSEDLGFCFGVTLIAMVEWIYPRVPMLLIVFLSTSVHRGFHDLWRYIICVRVRGDEERAVDIWDPQAQPTRRISKCISPIAS